MPFFQPNQATRSRLTDRGSSRATWAIGIKGLWATKSDCGTRSRGQRLLTVSAPGRQLCPYGFSPDGSRILGAALDGSACVWDAATGVGVYDVGSDEDSVSSARFSSDGRLVVVEMRDNTVRLCHAQTGHCLRILPANESIARTWDAPWVSPDGRRAVSMPKAYTIRVLDTETGGTVAEFATGQHSINETDVRFASGGSRIVTTCGDVRVWDADTGHLLLVRGHERGFPDRLALSLSSDGARAVVATSTGGLRVLETSGRKPFTVHALPSLDAVALSPDATRLFVEATNNGMHCFDTESGLRLWGGPAEYSTSEDKDVWFSADGGHFLHHEGYFRIAGVTDAASGEVAASVRDQSRWYGGCFSCDGKYVIDGWGALWNAETGSLIARSLSEQFRQRRAIRTDDWLLTAIAKDDGTIDIVETLSGEPVTVLHGWEAGLLWCRFLNKGRLLAAISEKGDVAIFDVTAASRGLTIHTGWRAEPGCVRPRAFSDNGRLVAAALFRPASMGLEMAVVTVWDTAVDAPLFTVSTDNERASAIELAFSPDGAVLFIRWSSGVGEVVDTQSGLARFRFSASSDDYSQGAFSPDGTRLVHMTDDDGIVIRSVATGEPLVTANGVMEWGRARFSPDGTNLLIACGNGHVNIRDAATGELRWDAAVREPRFPDAVFAADGRQVVTLSPDGSVVTRDTMTGVRLREVALARFHDVTFQPKGTPLEGRRLRARRVWSPDCSQFFDPDDRDNPDAPHTPDPSNPFWAQVRKSDDGVVSIWLDRWIPLVRPETVKPGEWRSVAADEAETAVLESGVEIARYPEPLRDTRWLCDCGILIGTDDSTLHILHVEGNATAAAPPLMPIASPANP